MGTSKRKHVDPRESESPEDAASLVFSSSNDDRSIASIVKVFIEMKKTEGFVMQEPIRSSNMHMAVPVLTSDHIQVLLHESRDVMIKNGTHVRLPPCCNGQSCLSMSDKIQGTRRGAIRPLCMWMTEDEYSNILEHGMMPADQRECVLCVSHSVTYKYMRSRLVSPLVNTVQVAEMQPFCVRVGEPGGYNENYCIPFKNDMCLTSKVGIIAPMLLPQLFLLEMKYTTQGVRYICQKRLVHEYVRDDVQYF